MRWLPSLANLNTCFRKAAAPNNGAAAFFFSTNYSVLHHVSPFFGDENFAGYPSKKAKLRNGDFSLAMAKKVEKQGIMTIILFFCLLTKNFFKFFFKKCPKGTFQIGIGNERGNKPASRCMRGGENS